MRNPASYEMTQLATEVDLLLPRVSDLMIEKDVFDEPGPRVIHRALRELRDFAFGPPRSTEGRWAKISPLSIRPMDNSHRDGSRPFRVTVKKRKASLSISAIILLATKLSPKGDLPWLMVANLILRVNLFT
jgi:hypothetical protein